MLDKWIPVFGRNGNKEGKNGSYMKDSKGGDDFSNGKRRVSSQHLETINKLVGEPIEICFYSHSGEMRVENKRLIFPATEDHLYIGIDAFNYFLVRWEDEDHQGVRDVVAVIRDVDERVVYINEDIPFILELFNNDFITMKVGVN